MRIVSSTSGLLRIYLQLIEQRPRGYSSSCTARGMWYVNIQWIWICRGYVWCLELWLYIFLSCCCHVITSYYYWCIRKPRSSSFISYNNNIISHNTNILIITLTSLSFNLFQPLSTLPEINYTLNHFSIDQLINWFTDTLIHWSRYNSNEAHHEEDQTVLMKKAMEPLLYKNQVNIAIMGHVR